MRIMGIDYGVARIGLAVSDALGMFANPICTINEKGMKKQLERVCEEIKKIEPEQIVVGLPKNMDGTEGKSAGLAREFAKGLENRCSIKVEFVDERLTTVSANRTLNELDFKGSDKRKKVVDTVAAVILLQAYLDGNRK